MYDLMKQVDPNQTYRNIQELYHIPWDPLTELIQNSVRACQDRLDQDLSYDMGSITIEIDHANHSIKVTDDGVGFTDLCYLGANRSTRSDFTSSTSSVQESGFGMGLERVVAWICGLSHIRETIPFARTMTRLNP